MFANKGMFNSNNRSEGDIPNVISFVATKKAKEHYVMHFNSDGQYCSDCLSHIKPGTSFYSTFDKKLVYCQDCVNDACVELSIIEGLVEAGHTEHCAKAQVWGGVDKCTCSTWS